MILNKIRNLLEKFITSSYAGIVISIIVLFITYLFIIPNFFKPDNLTNVLVSAVLMGLVAIGESMLLIAGYFDLSPGGISALSGVGIAFLLKNGLNAGLASLIIILLGILIGYTNGLLVNKLKFPAFIATLATGYTARGFAYTINEGQSTKIDPKSSIISLGKIQFLNIPLSVWILIIVIIYFIILLKFTKFGKHVYAIGGSNYTAKLYGIKNENIIAILFIITSTLSAVGGMLLAARMYSGSPIVSQGLEFEGIAAAILGGISLTGGMGSLVGTVAGIIILQSFTNGLLLMNVASYWQYVSRGALLVIALTFDFIRRKAKR